MVQQNKKYIKNSETSNTVTESVALSRLRCHLFKGDEFNFQTAARSQADTAAVYLKKAIVLPILDAKPMNRFQAVPHKLKK